ncbi:MAG: pyruvate ferredoxin oxidoreductase [Phycisphaerae bacterium]|nr:pyruvate ferredoxin oxidoreductase [Phycisphaerae bacterium]
MTQVRSQTDRAPEANRAGVEARVLPAAARAVSGNEASAWAARYARVQVISAYPITPQTTIVEKLGDWADNKEMDVEFIRVESEHSVMTSLVGASLAGARSFTATSGQGLLYMTESVHWAAGARLPIVNVCVGRGIAPPWNIWADHHDSLSMRDSGWMICYAANHQEIFDSVLMAFRICEDERVFLPMMVCHEGFTQSHTIGPVDMPDQGLVDEYLPTVPPEGWPHTFMDPSRPTSHGLLNMPDAGFFYEIRVNIARAQDRARGVIRDSADEFERVFGRSHGGLVEEYRTDDAEVVMLAIGTLADQAKACVDACRDRGYPLGAAKIRFVRPFPVDEVRDLARRFGTLAIMERDIAFGMGGGIVASDVRSAIQGRSDAIVVPIVAGLGGRDVSLEEQIGVAERVLTAARGNKASDDVIWLGLKE